MDEYDEGIDLVTSIMWSNIPRADKIITGRQEDTRFMKQHGRFIIDWMMNYKKKHKREEYTDDPGPR